MLIFTHRNLQFTWIAFHSEEVQNENIELEIFLSNSDIRRKFSTDFYIKLFYRIHYIRFHLSYFGPVPKFFPLFCRFYRRFNFKKWDCYETDPLSTFISPRSNTNLGLILHIWSTTSSVLKPNYWRHNDSKVPQIKTTLVWDQCRHNMINSVETVQNFQIIVTFQPIANHFKKPESMSAVVARRPKVLNEIWNGENRLTHVDHSGHRLLVKQVTRGDQEFRTANKITGDNTIYRLLDVWKWYFSTYIMLMKIFETDTWELTPIYFLSRSKKCLIRVPLFHLKLSPCSPIRDKHFIAASRSDRSFKVRQLIT